MKTLFRTEKTYLMLKNNQGKLEHIPTEVNYFYEYEDESPDFDYGSTEENEKEMKRFDSGELLNLCVIVEVKALGYRAIDSLGHCYVTSSNADGELLQIAIDHDMKNEACKVLKDSILDSAKEIGRFHVEM